MGAAPLGAWVARDYEVVAELAALMPTGVTVADSGRVFISIPRWGDEVSYTVAEIVDGRPVAFPDAEINRWSPQRAADTLVSVQSVVVDPAGYLWLLDSGSLAFAPSVEAGPKLVQVDLGTGGVVRVIHPSAGAVTPTTYLNDVRFDLSRGEAGYAYLTDSQPEGALIVVDLASGESWSRLRGHASTHAEDGFRAVVQGVVREGYAVGADGIALSADGDRLYFCPLSSRRLYSVDTAALRDRSLPEAQVAARVIDHGDKGSSDGLESDTDGAIYATAYEHSAVLKRAGDGTWTTVLHAPALLWPDTLSLAADGHLYVSVNQLPRTPLFNNGADDRVPPYQIIRIPVDARPVRLGPSAPRPIPAG
ncbi:L-dopachrome tautomerase-related protein [Dactylosporangium sp. AC04546]|uniref:major royal jelly family protein n=1 Tax=Dactylosporangium sp. AC04546 TaxID=2862460 RepID=UPI001EDD8354|nr:major royal jelly family protein [Dactylosporangium sp. AC04546]WVK78569.1 L-dopachrome tautomerase-related protein [Dactylosporangium sp. AC04546]